MSAEFVELYQRRSVEQAKIASMNYVAAKVTGDRNWASSRVSTGASRAINLQINDELKAANPVQWGANVIRAGRVRLGIAKAQPKHIKRLREIEEELIIVREKTPFGYIIDRPSEARSFDQALESKPMRGFLDEVPQEFGSLIQQFFTDPEGRRILTIVADFEPSDPDEAQDFTKNLAGITFEQMSYLHLKPELEQQNSVLLSPTEVFTLYRNAFADYSEGNLISHYGLTTGIRGRTIPDGLLIRESEVGLSVDGILEYKAWIRSDVPRRPNSLQPATNFITLSSDLGLERSNPIDPAYLGNLVHSMRPQLKSRPLAINPKIETIYAFPENSQIQVPGSERKVIPIYSGDFGEFISALKYLATSAK